MDKAENFLYPEEGDISFDDMEVKKVVDLKRSLPVRMTSILCSLSIKIGDTLFYYRVYGDAWNRAIVIKASDLYLTLMAIDTGFKGITWHVRRSSLLEPDSYLFDSQ